ncbi:MAG: hypothetical protein N3B13_12300 [Deltaproteobacteria bacterium]|nr:hypothetical protein [Deltaproteobacteria bacterium]
MIKKIIRFNSPELKKRLWKLSVVPYNSVLVGAIILTFINARVWEIEKGR